jgi:hypothetical protein
MFGLLSGIRKEILGEIGSDLYDKKSTLAKQLRPYFRGRDERQFIDEMNKRGITDYKEGIDKIIFDR